MPPDMSAAPPSRPPIPVHLETEMTEAKSFDRIFERPFQPPNIETLPLFSPISQQQNLDAQKALLLQEIADKTLEGQKKYDMLQNEMNEA